MTDQTVAGGFAAEPRLAASGAAVGDFISLLKPRVMSLVVFSGLAGLLIAPGAIHPVIAAVPRAPSTCGTSATSTRS